MQTNIATSAETGGGISTLPLAPPLASNTVSYMLVWHSYLLGKGLETMVGYYAQANQVNSFDQ